MKKYAAFLAGLLLTLSGFSQGITCEESEPFCTGTIYTFPAGTSGSAQPGADYGCLATQPAPAWYHMRILDPGAIDIYMYSTPLVDIDFICWGPFADPYDPCVSGLTNDKIVDCSYSIYPTETCNIPNGQTGEYYILLITNYSQQPCNITFSQTGGQGSTDCTILPPPVGNNGPLCVGETLELHADDVPNATYYWTGPAGFLSTLQNPVIPNVTLANGGDYSCIITVGGQSSDPAVTHVIIYSKPSATLLSSDSTICIGTPGYIVLHLIGFGPFSVDYSDGTSIYTAEGLSGPNDTIFVYPEEPTTYTLQVLHDAHCSQNLLLNDIMYDTYPYTSATISGSATICGGNSTPITFSLTGAPPWTLTYTQNGANPQTLGINTSPYVLNATPSVTTLYEIASVEDINCSGEIFDSALVTVEPTPQVSAGSDQTISYGAYTTLNGQVTGGSGSFTYHWEPAAKLVNPNILQPTTVNLIESTLFTLTATDNSSGCDNTDDMMVTIEGGPLGCTPTASPNVLCQGESSQLQALASGGSGDYLYTWSSDPPGFSSDLPDPTVSPQVSTTYQVFVDDGFNIISGSVTVSVNPLPLANAGPDQSIPNGAWTTLSGSASNGSGTYIYHWEPASKLEDPDIMEPVTINLYTTTLFSLTVTDFATGCVSATADNVSVVVGGDVLAVNPVAEPDEVCSGTTTQLFALAGGGSGTYTYTWISNPPGFTSEEADPLVSPTQTTVYTVEANDGFNKVEGSVAVTVNPSPVVNLGPSDTSICVYDTLVLDAKNPGASYQWSNGSTDRYLKVGTTGLGYDVKSFTVTVTDPAGCYSQDEITVYFDFSLCNSVEELAYENGLALYPNPGKGIIHIRLKETLVGNLEKIVVYNMLGMNVFETRQVNDRYDHSDMIINLEGLTGGIYTIRAATQDGLSFSRKYLLYR